ncbi:MAG: integral rane sensor signal transduction histidine kinase, partial [Gaiellaceae bacterium]|nr:integral rane sensor signal transduction histidine kinase [Gaiellaceae bacterium]
EVLEASRAGAVDAQEAELRRIERDLHDGAQARLVALGMSLGMAEQKLQTDPEAVQQLIAEARHGATEALEELRVLARGIHPPILTDRGLGPAVAALTARSPLPSSVSVDVTRRPPAAVETATRRHLGSTSVSRPRVERSWPRSRTTAAAARSFPGTG